MTSIQVYGIPTCGTCKKALQWLDAQQISYEFINTKEQPPSLEQIASWVKILGNNRLKHGTLDATCPSDASTSATGTITVHAAF